MATATATEISGTTDNSMKWDRIYIQVSEKGAGAGDQQVIVT